jgi:hypothetical protein
MDLLEFVARFAKDGHAVPDPHERVRLAVSFHSKIQFDGSGCWLWTAGLNAAGYATFNTARRFGLSSLGHRSLYACWVGPVADELYLDHLCRTPRCVNPDHLEPVTPRENVVRGVQARAVCVNGHPYEGNRIVNDAGTGWTRCRICHNERERKRYRTYPSRREPREPEEGMTRWVTSTRF